MQELTPETVEKVTVIGAGTMGHGIAQVFAATGYDVTLVDVDEEPLSAALEKMESSLERLGLDAETVLDRVTTTTDQAGGLEGADVMVEAVPETVELKQQVFAAADDVLPEHAVLATNTSTLPVSEIATATDRPERVVGMHFSSPVPLMPIVEVISGERTTDAVFQFTEALAEAVGKTPVLVERDVPGFILNRINYAYWSEALRQLDTDQHDREAVDAAIRRLGLPMGPFEVLDFAGVDVFYMVCQSMKDRDVPVVISELHEELFETGRHGMKTGAGFYEYPEPGQYTRVDIPHERRYEYDPYQMVASAVNASAWLLANDVTTRSDLDTAMRIGMSWPRGPLAMADEYGIDRIVETLERLHEESGREQYEPHPMLREMVADGRLGVATGEGFYEYDVEHESFGPVRYDRQEFVAYVTLPGADEDTVGEATLRGLTAALERAATDDAVRATILRGDGDSIAGELDAAELATLDDVDEATTYLEAVVRPAAEALRTHPTPTITLVEGAATGVGCDLAALADVSVAASGSEFSQPAARAGSLPLFRLVHGGESVGAKPFRELVVTGESLSATEAAERGLVDHVVSPSQAPDVARELARSTTASAPHAVAELKRLHAGSDERGDQTDGTVAALAELLVSEETRHGLSCVSEGEAPRWTL